MDEVIIQFETAKLAKKVGFNLEQPNFYHSHGYLNKDADSFFIPRFEAPTQALLQKYLRDVHRLHVNLSYDAITYDVVITYVSQNGIKFKSLVSSLSGQTLYLFTEYEEALEAGLQTGLKLIEIC